MADAGESVKEKVRWGERGVAVGEGVVLREWAPTWGELLRKGRGEARCKRGERAGAGFSVGNGINWELPGETSGREVANA